MQALPPGAARRVYAYPQPAGLGACHLLLSVFGPALQARRGGAYWVLGARSLSCACTVLAVHEVHEERRSIQHRELAAFLGAFPRECVFRCVHERDLGRVLRRGVLEGLDQEDTCVTSDVWLALEGARAYGPGWHLLVFELAVGREAVGPYAPPAASVCSADAHVCTVVNTERTVFRPLYPDQLLLHMVVELEVYACKAAPPGYEETPASNPELYMQRARQRALAAAVVASADCGSPPVAESTRDACWQAGMQLARAGVPQYNTPDASALDFCTDASCALLHATDARLCAADIFRDTSTSPVVGELGCSSPGTVDVYACDFEHKFLAAPMQDRSHAGADAVPEADAGAGAVFEAPAGADFVAEADAGACAALEAPAGADFVAEVDAGADAVPEADAGAGAAFEAPAGADFVAEAEAGADAVRMAGNLHTHPRMDPKRSGARTRAQSPNMVRSSKLERGSAVVMRHMLPPFQFCEGKAGHVWHVDHGKRPKFWVLAQDAAVGLKIAKINRGRSSYYAPHVMLILQRFQLERCAHAADAQAEA
tara:strand:+ start:4182 stop:5804 length:1623 start_codon:yes stop_codon:yes gene_type:complete